MLHSKLIEMHFRSRFTLVVVSSLEIRLRGVQLIGIQSLRRPSVDANTELIRLVPNLVSELGPHSHVPNLGEFAVTPITSPLNAHGEISRLVVVQLTDWFA